MLNLFVLLKANGESVISGLLFVLGFYLSVFLIFVPEFRLLILKKLKWWGKSPEFENLAEEESNLESELETTTEAVSNPGPVVENEIPIIEENEVEETQVQALPGEFYSDPADSNLFVCKIYDKFRIRARRTSTDSKDSKTFDLSHWQNLYPKKDSDAYLILLESREDLFISKITVDQVSNGLIITKNSTMKWEEIQDRILNQLFLDMNNFYSYLFQKQEILIERSSNDNVITLHFRLETMHHLKLGRRLFYIQGIVCSGDDFPMCMNHKGNYSILLEKGKIFNWGELIPEIKKVFNEYFVTGADFSGYMSNT